MGRHATARSCWDPKGSYRQAGAQIIQRAAKQLATCRGDDVFDRMLRCDGAAAAIRDRAQGRSPSSTLSKPGIAVIPLYRGPLCGFWRDCNLQTVKLRAPQPVPASRLGKSITTKVKVSLMLPWAPRIPGKPKMVPAK
jgi:hypothetical protein